MLYNCVQQKFMHTSIRCSYSKFNCMHIPVYTFIQSKKKHAHKPHFKWTIVRTLKAALAVTLSYFTCHYFHQSLLNF